MSESDPSRAGRLRVDRIGSTPTGGGIWTRTPMSEDLQVSMSISLLETGLLVSGHYIQFSTTRTCSTGYVHEFNGIWGSSTTVLTEALQLPWWSRSSSTFRLQLQIDKRGSSRMCILWCASAVWGMTWHVTFCFTVPGKTMFTAFKAGTFMQPQ